MYVPAVTPLLARVVATDHPAVEETVPVTSPVRVTDCADANSVAVSALPSTAPLNLVADTVPVLGLTVTAAVNLDSPVTVAVAVVSLVKIGYSPSSVEIVCVSLVSVLRLAESVIVFS